MPRVYTVPIGLLGQPQTASSHKLVFKCRVCSAVAGSVVAVSLENSTVHIACLGFRCRSWNVSSSFLNWTLPVNIVALSCGYSSLMRLSGRFRRDAIVSMSSGNMLMSTGARLRLLVIGCSTVKRCLVIDANRGWRF